jgi:hypothetical protein
MVTIDGIKIADIGFYINLDERTDRKERIEKQLEDFNIKGVERLSGFTDTGANTLNCKKSHYETYKKLMESEHETVLVLEDDCLFLDVLKERKTEIFNDINNTDWDLFWLGCRNRRNPIFYKNNCYRISSVSYAQSYLIKKKFAKYVYETFPITDHVATISDETLCLAAYGYDVMTDPSKFNFYELDQPLDVLTPEWISLCYQYPLTTQYASYSNLWHIDVDYSEYIKGSHPKNENEC